MEAGGVASGWVGVGASRMRAGVGWAGSPRSAELEWVGREEGVRRGYVRGGEQAGWGRAAPGTASSNKPRAVGWHRGGCGPGHTPHKKHSPRDGGQHPPQQKKKQPTGRKFRATLSANPALARTSAFSSSTLPHCTPPHHAQRNIMKPCTVFQSSPPIQYILWRYMCCA